MRDAWSCPLVPICDSVMRACTLRSSSNDLNFFFWILWLSEKRGSRESWRNTNSSSDSMQTVLRSKVKPKIQGLQLILVWLFCVGSCAEDPGIFCSNFSSETRLNWIIWLLRHVSWSHVMSSHEQQLSPPDSYNKNTWKTFGVWLRVCWSLTPAHFTYWCVKCRENSFNLFRDNCSCAIFVH